jgi:hypothetical protein
MPVENNAALPSTWAEFLEEVDAALCEEVKVHCIGGFVLTVYYGLPRVTGDIDCFSIMPMHCAIGLQAIAGPDSMLAKKHGVHLQHVTVNSLPEDYEARLVEMFPRQFKKLRLHAPEPYDLILSKLERNSLKDRDDVRYLAKLRRLNAEVLRERYEKEMRSNLANESRHDLTLKLWLESCFPEPSPSQ